MSDTLDSSMKVDQGGRKGKGGQGIRSQGGNGTRNDGNGDLSVTRK